MRRAGYKSIYGTATTCKVAPALDPCPVVDPCDSVEALATFVAMLSSLHAVVKEFFPATTVTGAIITNIDATAAMNHFTYVRFAWIMDPAHKDLVFDPKNREHLLQLRDLYLKNGFSWAKDPLVAALVVDC